MWNERVPATKEMLVDQRNYDVVDAASILLTARATSAAPTEVAGLMWYNSDRGVFQMFTDIPGTMLDVGEETRTRIVNKTLSPLLNGDVVYISGASGSKTAIALADADIETQTDATIGVLTMDLADNQEGYAVSVGTIHDLNTNAYAEGTILYLSQTPGKWSITPPIQPASVVQIGIIQRQHATQGELLVDIRKRWAKDIRQISKQDTGWAPNEALDSSYDYSTRKITITNTSVTNNAYLFYQGNLVQTIAPLGTWTSTAHDATNGGWYLYYNGIAYVWSQTVWTYDMGMLGYVKYISASPISSFGITETHGLMDRFAHEEFHQSIGTYKAAGGTFSGYVLGSYISADRQVDISSTTLKDEDCITSNTALIGGTGTYTLAYISSASVFTFINAQDHIVPSGATVPTWNNTATGALTPLINNQYMNVWIYGIPVMKDSNSQKRRYVILDGQSANTSRAVIDSEDPRNINIGDLASNSAEWNLFGRVLLRYSASLGWSVITVNAVNGTRSSSSQTAVTGLIEVIHDTTLTGTGEVAQPLSVVTSALAHQSLSGAGTNTHTAIDAHIASTNNPHTTTLIQASSASGITPAANTFPYYVSATSATTATISSFARTILDDTTDVIMRTTIGAAPISHSTSANTYGLSTTALYGHAKSTATVPIAAGVASAGTAGAEFANYNHIHPVDTSASAVYTIVNANSADWGSGITSAEAATLYVPYTGATASVNLGSQSISATNLTVTGNTTIGNASTDTLTILSSAVTWSNNPTHSGNHTYTGAVGAASVTTTGNITVGINGLSTAVVLHGTALAQAAEVFNRYGVYCQGLGPHDVTSDTNNMRLGLCNAAGVWTSAYSNLFLGNLTAAGAISEAGTSLVDKYTSRAGTVGSVVAIDTRWNNYEFQQRPVGAYWDYKRNTADGLDDGGASHGVHRFRPWGTGDDVTGGPAHELGFTVNGNLWIRTSTGVATWGAWSKIVRIEDTGYVKLTNATGYVEIGAWSTWANYITDMAYHKFNKPIMVVGQVEIYNNYVGIGGVRTGYYNGLTMRQGCDVRTVCMGEFGRNSSNDPIEFNVALFVVAAGGRPPVDVHLKVAGPYGIYLGVLNSSGYFTITALLSGYQGSRLFFDDITFPRV